MSETLDYFVPHRSQEDDEDDDEGLEELDEDPAEDDAQDAAIAEEPPAPALADGPADVRRLLDLSGAGAPPPSRTSRPARPASRRPQAFADRRGPGPTGLPGQPVPAQLPPVVPPEGLPWSPSLVDALLPALNPRQYLVYHAIFMASYALGLPYCELHRRDIQASTGLSEATVRRSLADLSGELGLLQIYEKPRFLYELRLLIPTQVLRLWHGSLPASPAGQ